MNLKYVGYLLFIALLSGVLFSCYKSKNFSPNLTGQIDSAIVTQNNDQIRVTGVIDKVFNDVNTILTDTSKASTICNANIQINYADTPNTISITYQGKSCDNVLTMGGNVTVYLNPGTSWDSVGDTIGVNFYKLAVQGLGSDTNSIRLNGTFFYTNVSGGSLASLTAPGSKTIIHEILSPYLGVWFNYADTASWQVARKRTYTYNTGVVISTAGMDSVGGIANVSEWGGNRYGNSFITSIDTALTTTAGCNYQVTSGHLTMTNPSGVTTLRFGLNNSGAPAASCPLPNGNFFYQFSWSGTGADPYSGVRSYPDYF